MKVELEIHIPYYVPYVQLINVKVGKRYVGYINHIIEELEPDIYLCSVDIQEKHEKYIRKIIENR